MNLTYDGWKYYHIDSKYFIKKLIRLLTILDLYAERFRLRFQFKDRCVVGCKVLESLS